MDVTRRWIALVCLAVVLLAAMTPAASYGLWLALPVAFFVLWTIAFAGPVLLRAEEPAAPIAVTLAVSGSRAPPLR
jgi:hypothetical protein